MMKWPCPWTVTSVTRLLRWVWRLTALVLLISLGIGPACGGSGGGISLIHNVPSQDTRTALSVNVKAFRQDDDLANAYDSWKESYKGRLEQLGVDPDDVDNSAHLMDTLVLSGRLDVGKIRQTLDHNGYSQSQFDPNTVIWAGGPLGQAYVEDGIAIIGQRVEDCIHVMRYSAESLGDVSDVGNVIDRLGDGLITMVLKYPLHKGMNAAAYSVEKTGRTTCRVTTVYKFGNQVDPRDALDAVENHELRRITLRNVDIRQDGYYITSTGEANTDDIFVPWGTCDIIVGST